MAGDTPVASSLPVSLQAQSLTTALLTTSAVIAAANPKRKGCVVYNGGTTTAYVSLALTAVAASCTYAVPAGQSQIIDFCGAIWGGAISAIRTNTDNKGVNGVTVYELL